MKVENFRLFSVAVLSIALIFVAVMISSDTFSFGIIRGQSMEPKIKEGDFILIKKISATDVVVGDIIAYDISDKKYVHEVTDISTGPEQIIFKTNCDPPDLSYEHIASSSSLIGEVIYVIPKIGLPIVYMELFIFAAGGFVIVSMIWSWARYLVK